MYTSASNRDNNNNNNNNNNNMQQSSIIRLQSQPEPCLDDISSQTHVLDQINHVRLIQGQKSKQNSNLYSRHWIDRIIMTPATTNLQQQSTTIRENKNEDDNDNVHSFSVLQFNTLAEGLSSGPTTITSNNNSIQPPAPRGQKLGLTATRKTNNNMPLYGGFNTIPHPEISLDFSLRRWRLLEVLLGLNITNNDNNNCDINRKQQEKEQQCQPQNDISDGMFDIIAMEEVDHYHGFFSPILKLFNYKGIFIPKPNAPGAYDGWYSDGCALFWKETAFQYISHVTNRFKAGGNQVYIICTLRHLQSGKEIIVVVTHLKAKNSDTNEQIRTEQVKELMHCVSSYNTSIVLHDDGSSSSSSSSSSSGGADHVPIIILGDFNADPYGEGKTCIKSILSHSSPSLQSTYDLKEDGDGAGGGSGESYFTTWKTRGEESVRRIIDYIFYSNQCPGFRCTHVLSIPKEYEIEATKLPGFRYPSDHLSIGSKFEIKG
jgi:mRNA deadenylase 3'-5' endonuclease subunit Ccr4